MSLTKITTGAINQMMAVDGTTTVLDAIHHRAFTMGGGVGNAWDSSNFRTLLGAQAPVIAQACTNLLSAENASFEGGTVGTWSLQSNCAVAVSTAQAWHGTHSLRMTTAAAGIGQCQVGVTGNASTTYTASCRFKGNVNSNYGLLLLDTGMQQAVAGATVIGDGSWQGCTVTGPWSAGNPNKWIYFVDNTGGVNAITYIDAVQLEAGAVQTPFAVDSRTACTMTIPTASIGLVPGQDFSFLAIVNGPWAGDDGVAHYILDAKGAGAGDVFSIYKHTDNKLYFAVGDKSAVTAALDTTTWAANVNHVVIGTVTGGTINVYLAGTAGTAATGATREAALNANTYIGTKIDGTLQANAAELCAMWGRVLTNDEIAGFTP